MILNTKVVYFQKYSLTNKYRTINITDHLEYPLSAIDLNQRCEDPRAPDQIGSSTAFAHYLCLLYPGVAVQVT